MMTLTERHPLTERVLHRLQEVFPAAVIDIEDNSWRHAGHAGVSSDNIGGTHLKIRIVDEGFRGVGLLDRHRQVHQALSEERREFLHALELATIVPGESA
jgi:stress-induced morphogen